jgi:hypothetical protein
VPRPSPPMRPSPTRTRQSVEPPSRRSMRFWGPGPRCSCGGGRGLYRSVTYAHDVVLRHHD